MKNIEKRDGFCRAPRIEMIVESNELATMSFDEMLKKAKYTIENSNDNATIQALGKANVGDEER